MNYTVESFSVVPWGRSDASECARILQEKLNSLASRGYEIITITSNPLDEESVLITYKKPTL